MSAWLQQGLLALVTASLLWTAEEAYDGAGLQWVVLWCLAAVAACVQLALLRWRGRHRAGDGSPAAGSSGDLPGAMEAAGRGVAVLPDARLWSTVADPGWCLIVAGQWLSTLAVFVRGGDCRAALNLSFEWLGLWLAWWLLRWGLADVVFRRLLAATLVAVLSGVAVWGIWQHHVLYAEHAAWYQPRRAELDSLQGQADPQALLRAAELQQELQRMGVPLEGAQRLLWEQRLLSSSEPTGTFALANTLGGLLAVAVVLLAGGVAQRIAGQQQLTWSQAVCLLLCAGVVLYCLILTKSRTAWAGTAVGLSWLLAARWGNWSWLRRSRLLWTGLLLTLACVLTAAAYGALDKEVLLESPRSLQFRLLYWLGTARVLQTQPLLGVGPGNFREPWLRYKPLESSEEIRDPHNLLLESWTSGGLISLAGVLLCMWALLGRRAADSSGSGAAQLSRARPLRGRIWPGICAGFALHGGWSWLNGGALETSDVAWLLIPATAILLSLGGLSAVLTVSGVTGQAVAVTLGVHLLGAGGFQMPVVMLCLAAGLAAWLSTTEPVAELAGHSVPEGVPARRRRLLGGVLAPLVAGLLVVLAGLCVVWYGLRPVRQAQAALAVAEDAQLRGQDRAARDALQLSIAADPLSLTSRQRLAELETYRLTALLRTAPAAPEAAEQQLQRALAACDGWLLVAAGNPAAWRLRAVCHQAAAQLHQDPQLQAQAIDDQIRVVQLYPGSAADWWRLVELQRGVLPDARQAQRAAEFQLRSAAERTLQLHEINVSWGHQDRFLSAAQIATLNSVLAGG